MEQLSDNLELATVTRDEDMWILRVEANGKVQEYRCNSEVQARARMRRAGRGQEADGLEPVAGGNRSNH